MDIYEALEQTQKTFNLIELLLKRLEKWKIGQKISAAITAIKAAIALLFDMPETKVLPAFTLGLTGIAFLTFKRNYVDARSVETNHAVNIDSEPMLRLAGYT